MNDEYEERGVFKQFVLVAFLIVGWLASKWERLRKSEAFWWCVSAFFFVIAIYCLLKITATHNENSLYF